MHRYTARVVVLGLSVCLLCRIDTRGRFGVPDYSKAFSSNCSINETRKPLPSDLKTVFFSTGQPLRLRCPVRDDDDDDVSSVVSWSRDYDGLAGVANCSDRDLVVSTMRCQDVGDYFCTHANVTTSWTLVARNACAGRVRFPSKINTLIQVRETASVSLKCSIDVYTTREACEHLLDGPPPVITWIRGRNVSRVNCIRKYPLSHCPANVDYHSNDNSATINSSLLLQRARGSDAGWYTCSIRRSIGDTSFLLAAHYYVQISDDNDHDDHHLLIVILCSSIGSACLLSLIFICVRRHCHGSQRGTALEMSSPFATQNIYISYAEDSLDHLKKVRQFCDAIKLKGFEFHLFEDERDEASRLSVPIWLERQIREARRILVLCSPAYFRVSDSTERHQCNDEKRRMGWEARVAHEWRLISARRFAEGADRFCLCIVWDNESESTVPFALTTRNIFKWPSESEKLFLHMQPPELV